MMRRLPALLLLAFAWMAIGWSFTVLNFALGLAVAGIALHVAGASGLLPTIRPLPLLALALLFLKELALSAMSVVRIVLNPRIPATPGIVEVPLALQQDGEIALAGAQAEVWLHPDATAQPARPGITGASSP